MNISSGNNVYHIFQSCNIECKSMLCAAAAAAGVVCFAMSTVGRGIVCSNVSVVVVWPS